MKLDNKAPLYEIPWKFEIYATKREDAVRDKTKIFALIADFTGLIE